MDVSIVEYEKATGAVFIIAKGKQGDIEIIAEMLTTTYCLILYQLHIQGTGAGSSSISELRAMAQTLGKQQKVREVIVFGARRVTGSSVGMQAKSAKGKVPKPLVFKIE
jgi:hypothetical protein